MWGILSLLGVAVYLGYGAYQDVQGLNAYRITHETWSGEAIQTASDERQLMDQKLARILETLERDLYLTGMGSVGTFGGEESYVRINRGSDAKIYKDGDRVKITCADLEGKPEAVLRVNGTFSSSDSDLLISFSKQAAENLGLIGRTDVELEPVLGEQ